VIHGVIDAADECPTAVDNHQLAVHATQHVDAGAEQALRGLEAAHFYAGV
jgi:hypothetical protein